MQGKSIHNKIDLDNITAYLSRNALEFPDKPAILHPAVISFKELDKEVDRYAVGLASYGIEKGTHTILMVSDASEFFILCFALLRVGAVPIMIDPGMGKSAMVRALSGSDARAFIGVAKAHLLRYLYPRSFSTIQRWIHTGKSWLPGSIPSSILRADVDTPVPQCKMSPDDQAAIFFTSGSTGAPKGVIYHARTMEAQVRLMAEHFKYGPEEIDMCTFPLLGLFVTCLGSSLVMADMNPLQPAKLNPQNIISNLNDHHCTQMFGSPMILNRLVRYAEGKDVKLLTLKRIISAGAPVPHDIIKAFLKLAVKSAQIHTPYGATEALPISDITSDELLEQSEEESSYSGGICVGYALPGIIINIIGISDDPLSDWSDDLLCETDVVGEIVVKGALVSREYKNNPEANTLSKIYDSGDGKIWHRMGDLGRKDDRGRIWFYGRKSHRVTSSSGTLFTIPVEAVFNQHPDVFRAALLGVSKELWKYEKPVICIQREKNSRALKNKDLEGELLELAHRSELTKVIRHILFHPGFPVDPRHNAKILREKLAIWAGRRIK